MPAHSKLKQQQQQQEQLYYQRFLDSLSNPQTRRKYDLEPALKDCVVIGIRTQNLDKERLRWSHHYQDIWYCYFDDIPLQDIFVYQTYPLPPIYDNKQITDTVMKDLLNETPLMRIKQVNLNNVKFASCLNEFYPINE